MITMCDIPDCNHPCAMAFCNEKLFDMKLCTEHFMSVMTDTELRAAIVFWILQFEREQLKGASS